MRQTYKMIMFLQQDAEFTTVGKFVATQCIEVRPKNCELSTYVHRKIEEERVISALRNGVNNNLHELQSFNGVVRERRAIFSKDAIGRYHQFSFVCFIKDLFFRVPGQIDIGEHDNEDAGYDRGTTKIEEY